MNKAYVFFVFILTLLANVCLAESVAISQMVPMADGVKLYTEIFKPAKEGKFPVIFTRSPYVGQKDELESHRRAEHGRTDAGYVLIFQHVRGSGLSEGFRIPYQDERADGLAMLEWIRKQDFYNGEIFLSGGSYTSSVHMAYLDTVPSDVKGAILRIQDCKRYNVIFRNGFFKWGLHGRWFIGEYGKTKDLKKAKVDFAKVFPKIDFSRQLYGAPVESFDNPLRHPDENDAFWQTPEGGAEYADAVTKPKIPILLISSFYDIYTGGILDMWNSIPEAQRKNCAFIITPYTHNFRKGIVEFPNADIAKIWKNYEINWFDHIRKNAPLEFCELGKTKWYTLFENKWHSNTALKDAEDTLKLYLNNRTLEKNPADAAEISYDYDPMNPAVFNGGVCLNFGGMQVQSAPNARPDILSFVSDTFDTNIIAEGTMQAELFVKSDCEDTCFYARVSLVKKDGRALSLRDDITSLSHELGNYRAGATVSLRFNFVPHSFMIEAGDALRIDISSSCAPHFSAHTNYAGNQLTQENVKIAHNTIITGKSSLTLRVKPTKK